MEKYFKDTIINFSQGTLEINEDIFDVILEEVTKDQMRRFISEPEEGEKVFYKSF